MDMFNRLKAAVDTRIAEEQARSRTLQTQQGRSGSTARRANARTSSPAVRADRVGDTATAGKGPDPREFEQAFVIDDEEASTRAGTPQPGQEKQIEGLKDGEVSTEKTDSDTALSQRTNDASMPTLTELPTDVKTKLRKLERLEPRYQELLRSYRIAHARMSDIEIFEAALRENTPLTSIQDPAALTEYLNQLRLKSDMVVDELKRLTGERDSLKTQLAASEKKNEDIQAELVKVQVTSEPESLTSEPVVQAATPKASLDIARTLASPKSRTPSIAGFSLFSPKSKPTEPQPVPTESEEFFSYDNKLPRVEAELKSKQEEIVELQKEVRTLTGDLEVARESTSSMARSLEESTKEVNSLKDANEKARAELFALKTETTATIGDLHSQLEDFDQKVRTLENQATNVTNQADIEKELNEHKNLLASAKKDLEKLRALNEQNTVALEDVSKAQGQIAELKAEIERLQSDKIKDANKHKILDDLVTRLKKDIANADVSKKALETQLESSAIDLKSLQSRLADAETKIKSSETAQALESPLPTPTIAAASATPATSSKKKNNKKKKGGKTGNEHQSYQSGNAEESLSAAPSTAIAEEIAALQGEVSKLTAEVQAKDAAIERLGGKIKDQDELKEEIDSLRDDLINVGQEHVIAKDKIKDLENEKQALQAIIAELEDQLRELRSSHTQDSEGSEQAQKDLADQFNELKIKATNLETDLTVAQQLASSRFKDLTELRGLLQKAQPELTSLRKENSELKTLKVELSTKVEDLQKIEARQGIMRTELAEVRRRLGEKDSEAKALQQKLTQESSGKLKAESAQSQLEQDLQKIEREKMELVQKLDTTASDLTKVKDDLQVARKRIRETEDALTKAQREVDGLREDIQLKAAQHASAESLMNSMRDQTSEMATQTKEARDRVESLEEEIADAHRLLNERNREAETMRRLLAEVEGRSDTRVREMKERLDTAIEERDKAEDEANTSSRRRARELEDLRSKVRDIQRELKRAEEEKDGLEELQKDWKRRREDLENQAQAATKEAEEVRRAMTALRDALDESEKQARELEKQKSDLRRSIEETQQRLDRAQKSNKVMADEIKSIQTRTKPQETLTQSVRSSLDSSRPQSRGIMSPTGKVNANTPSSSTDTLNGHPAASSDYLKNVLLQFLEQKDKKHQIALVPVLSNLLHFDRSDEQKWIAAISTR